MMFNRYAYANNNPYKYVDPDGRLPFLIPLAIFVAKELAAEGIEQATGIPMPTVKNGMKLAAKHALSEGVKRANKDLARQTVKQSKEVVQATAKKGGTNKADTLKPGPFAKESIPARGPERNFTKAERDKINKIGNETGCHTCGIKEPGTKSGNYIPDHQPANALNTSGGPQKLYPHCKTCSGRQAGQVTQAKRKLNQ